jgi:uncharacterized protein YhaN
MLFVWMILSIGGVGFAIADYFMLITDSYFHIAGFSLVSLMAAMQLISRANQKKIFLKEQFKASTEKLADVTKDITEMNEALQSLLDKYKINSPDLVKRMVWKRNDLKNQIDNIEKEIKTLLGDDKVEELEVQLQSLEKTVFDNKVKLENYDDMDPAEIERLKLVVSQIEEQHQALESELKYLTRQIETAEGGNELLGSYLERKECLNETRHDLVEELTILGLTKDCIEKTRQQIMFSTLELLEKRASEILELVTDGKYNQVRFDKASLKFEVFSEKKNDWVDPHKELSRETVDQVYLTARLALTEILAGDVAPPIILDDPFSGFDQQRRENTMKLLKQMSEDRQILLLTTDNDYDNWADNMVTL